MTTSSVTCIHDDEIDPKTLGDLLHALATSERTALPDTDYFDFAWAHDVPNAPEPSDGKRGRSRRGPQYHRIVAVQNGAYVGFLAGKLNAQDGFVALAAALNPGSGDGVGPKLLDAFSELAVEAGKTRLRLVPDRVPTILAHCSPSFWEPSAGRVSRPAVDTRFPAQPSSLLRGST